MYDKYEVDDKILIGTSRSGNIYRVLCKNSQEIVAMNIIDK